MFKFFLVTCQAHAGRHSTIFNEFLAFPSVSLASLLFLSLYPLFFSFFLFPFHVFFLSSLSPPPLPLSSDFSLALSSAPSLAYKKSISLPVIVVE